MYCNRLYFSFWKLSIHPNLFLINTMLVEYGLELIIIFYAYILAQTFKLFNWNYYPQIS